MCLYFRQEMTELVGMAEELVVMAEKQLDHQLEQPAKKVKVNNEPLEESCCEPPGFPGSFSPCAAT